MKKFTPLLLAIVLYSLPAFSTETLKQEFSTPTPVRSQMMIRGMERMDWLVHVRKNLVGDEVNVPELITLIEHATKHTRQILGEDREKVAKLDVYKKAFLDKNAGKLSPEAIMTFQRSLVSLIEDEKPNLETSVYGMSIQEPNDEIIEDDRMRHLSIYNSPGYKHRLWTLPVMDPKPYWGFQTINWGLLNLINMAGCPITDTITGHGVPYSRLRFIDHDNEHGGRYDMAYNRSFSHFRLNSDFYRTVYERSFEKNKMEFQRTQVALWNMMHESMSWLTEIDYKAYKTPRSRFIRLMEMQIARPMIGYYDLEIDIQNPDKDINEYIHVFERNCRELLSSNPEKYGLTLPPFSQIGFDHFAISRDQANPLKVWADFQLSGEQDVRRIPLYNSSYSMRAKDMALHNGVKTRRYSPAFSFSEFECYLTDNPMYYRVICKVEGEEEVRSFLIDSELHSTARDQSGNLFALKAAGYEFKHPYELGNPDNINFLDEARAHQISMFKWVMAEYKDCFSDEAAK